MESDSRMRMNYL